MVNGPRVISLLVAAVAAFAPLGALADDASHLLRHVPADSNWFQYVNWEKARAADPALLELARLQMMPGSTDSPFWDQLADVRASVRALHIPFGKPDEPADGMIVSDGLSKPQVTPPPSALRRTKVRGVEITTIIDADFAMAKLGNIELGGTPSAVRAAIERAKPAGRKRRPPATAPLTAEVRDAIATIGPEADFWWLVYWGDSQKNANGMRALAVKARLGDRPDLVAVDILFFYPDEAHATASRNDESSIDFKKGLRSIKVNAGADSFHIEQRGNVVSYSLTAPAVEIASFRKLLHRMWAGMQKGGT
jgi:hypothetical protein